MLKETAFVVGGLITLALGVMLLVVLVLAGGTGEPLGSWLAAGAALVLGAFFLVVARDARRYRTEYLAAAEEGRELPPEGPPP